MSSIESAPSPPAAAARPSLGARRPRSVHDGRLVAFLVPLALVIAGCYTYRASTLERVPVGATMRATLSGSEAEKLEGIIGPTRSVEGDLVERLDTSVVIAIDLQAASAASVPATPLQRRIEIPTSDLRTVEVRALDPTRTALLIGGAVAAVVAIALARSQGFGAGSNNGGGGAENRLPTGIPLLLFRFGTAH